MSHLPFSERDIERLLEGDVPPGRGDLAHLARLFACVRAEETDVLIPPMSAGELLAELDASELTGRLQSGLLRPRSGGRAAPGAARPASLACRRRRGRRSSWSAAWRSWRWTGPAG